MEAARVSTRSGAVRLDRSRLVLLGALLALAVVAWLVTNDRMEGMESMPGMALGTLGFYATVWVVMMAAMMFPTVAPTVLTYDRLRDGHRAGGDGGGGRRDRSVRRRLSARVDGGGLAAYALFELVRAIDPAFLAWDEAGRYVTGGVIVAAAVYQVTPLKRACLAECRSPMTFLAERWRDGRVRCARVGDPAWRLVPRLLLGADGRAVRGRPHEPRLDGADRGVHRGREAAAVADRSAQDRGPGAARARARRGVLPR